MNIKENKNLTIDLRDRILRGQEAIDFAKRHGICPNCGQVRTHKKEGKFLTKLVPLTEQNMDTGEYNVYKGYCIQPQCYSSVEQVKELLGETTRRRSRPNPSDSSRTGASQPWPSEATSGSGQVFRQNPIAFQPPPTGQTDPSRHFSARRPSRTFDEGEDTFQPDQPSGHMRRDYGSDPPALGISNLGTISSGVVDNSAEFGFHASQEQRPSNMHQPQSFGFAGSTDPRTTQTYPSSASTPLPGRDAGFTPHSNHFSQNPSAFRSNNYGSQRPTSTATGFVSEETKFEDSVNNLVGIHARPRPVTATSRTKSQVRSMKFNELEDLVRERDYVTFLNKFDSLGEDPVLILESFELFRKYVVMHQMERPNGVILGGEGWVKALNSKTYNKDLEEGRDIVLAGLLAFLSLASLPGNYRKSMVKKGTVDLASKLMDEFGDDPEIAEVICAFYLILALHEKDGMNAKSYARIGVVVSKLVDVVNSRRGDVQQEIALRALYFLARQEKKSRDTSQPAFHDVKKSLGNDSSIRCITELMERGDMTELGTEAAMELLWRMSFNSTEDHGYVMPATEETARAVVLTMQRLGTVPIMAFGCGILANLSTRKGFPVQWTEAAVENVCDFLCRSNEIDEELAISSSHAICNLLSNTSAKPIVLQNDSIIRSILNLLRGPYSANEMLVENTCLAISYACRENQPAKEMVMREGGYELVVNAFDSFVTFRDGNPSMPVKEAALCAMGTLSSSQLGAQAMVRSGMLDRLLAELRGETYPHFRSLLETIKTNVLRATEGDFTSNSGSMLASEPGRLPQLLHEANTEQMTVAIFEELRSMGENALASLADQGFESLLIAMSQYITSPTIQEHGCAILAEAYFRLPTVALDSPVEVAQGQPVQIHGQEGFQAIVLAMSNHPSHAGIQKFGFMALYNFFIPLLSDEGQSSARQAVSGWLEPVIKTISVDALNANFENPVVLQSCIQFYLLLVMLCETSVLMKWNLHVLQCTFHAMEQFPENAELNVAACDLLMALQDDGNSVEFMGNSTIIFSLLNLLENGNVEIASVASAVLASLSTQVFTAVTQIMQVPNSISKLIACMKANQSDPQVQTSISSVFESVINFEDHSVRVSIFESGGLITLLGALNVHPENSAFVEIACRVIGLLIPAIDKDSLYATQELLGTTLIRLLESNIENPASQAAVMGALSIYAEQDDRFKYGLVNATFLEGVVGSMRLNLGSAELQQSACMLLRVLTSEERKQIIEEGRRMIGQCGGVDAVVDAMLVHIQSTLVVKDGLMVLKFLARESSNKPKIRPVHSDAIRMAMRFHFRDQHVLGNALSALNNIAVDARAGTVEEMEPETLDIVIGVVMRRFPLDENLQKTACFFLKFCCHEQSNLRLMNEARTELVPLLDLAAETFPRECAGPTEFIIRKLNRVR